ncbi:MAG: DUF1566 domain-containing protein [Proteobacteria bacterium]|nr:DUF1566 domain-containing protein [Pseudomonadota bacterium]
MYPILARAGLSLICLCCACSDGGGARSVDAGLPDRALPVADAMADASRAERGADATTGDAGEAARGDASSPDAKVVLSTRLAQTGQRGCYSALGAALDCDGTGQDADERAGLAWPSPRFVAAADGTISDALTGLVWLADANCMATHYAAVDTDATASVAGDGRVTWQHALNFARGVREGTFPLCAAGTSDWRLPNLKELQSLLDAGQPDTSTWLGANGFLNVVGITPYWSSNTMASQLKKAWTAELVGGSVGGFDKTGDHGLVWLVRTGASAGPAPVARTGAALCYDEAGSAVDCDATGQDGERRVGRSWPVPRFLDRGDGTVSDALTALTWLQDANCIATRYPGFDSDGTADGQVGWERGLNFVRGLNDGTYPDCAAGHSDWRLPNRTELQSLVDLSRAQPALPADAPFLNVSATGYFWSSTSDPLLARADYAWGVYLFSGFTTRYLKGSEARRVWPVRDTP